MARAYDSIHRGGIIMSTTRTVRWSRVDSPGIEHCHLETTAVEVNAEGVVVALRGDVRFGLHYRLTCDTAWRIRNAEIRIVGKSRSLKLISDGDGHWRDQSGSILSELDGCIDIDISATPFTNTLPIRRLNLKPGQSAELSMVYIAVPDLTPRKVKQRYTCLQANQLYRYEGLDSGFTADVVVDEDGLIVDYPGIFSRAG